MGEFEELKARLELLVSKDSEEQLPQLLLEIVLQLAELNENFKRGLVVFEGGEAEDVEEEGQTNEFP